MINATAPVDGVVVRNAKYPHNVAGVSPHACRARSVVPGLGYSNPYPVHANVKR